jgi:hypothetical protein
VTVGCISNGISAMGSKAEGLTVQAKRPGEEKDVSLFNLF